MRLLEQVKQLNKDELVCIGSKSAFFFIGYPNEFIEQEERLSEEWKRKLQGYHKASIRSVELHMNDKPNPDKFIIKKMQDIYTGRLFDKKIGYEELFKEWDKKHKSLQKTVEYNKRACDGFKRFADRKVLEVYKSCNDRDNIILCSGQESGNYWLHKEYKTIQRTMIYENETNEKE